MKARPAHVPGGRLVAGLLLTTHLSACTSWHVQNVTPEQVIARDHPNELRVTRTDSSRIVLSLPRVAGDSLFGFDSHAEFGMPLSDVSSVAEQRFDAGKSIAAGVGIPLVTFGFVYLLACGGSNGGNYVC